jgi:hypothetical protein
MPGEVDKLQVKIEANADKAFKAIETLISRLGEFNRMSGKSVGALINLNDRLKELQTNTSKIRNIRNPLRNFSEGAKETGESVTEAIKPTRELTRSVSRLDKIGTATGKVLKGIAKGGFTLLGKAAHATVGKLNKFLHSIMRIAGYRAIRSALRFITQGFSQGIENLYLWSQAWNTTFAPTMDRFASSMLYLKNGFASMFSPLIEYFMPYIELLVDKLVDAFNWVQRLFAELTGRNTWNKAVKVQTQYKEATDGTAKSVKALREQIQLMDFDELNNLTDSDNGSGGGAGDVLNPNPAEMFTLEKTAVEGMKGTFWENVKKKITGWLEDQGLWDENGFKWDKFGTIIGGVIHDAWQVFLEWFKGIDWAGIFSDLKDFIGGLLRGLFPEEAKRYDDFKDIQALIKEVGEAVSSTDSSEYRKLNKVKPGEVPDAEYWSTWFETFNTDEQMLITMREKLKQAQALVDKQVEENGGKDTIYTSRAKKDIYWQQKQLDSRIESLHEKGSDAATFALLGMRGEEYAGTLIENIFTPIQDAVDKVMGEEPIDLRINGILDEAFDRDKVWEYLNSTNAIENKIDPVLSETFGLGRVRAALANIRLDLKINSFLDQILNRGSYSGGLNIGSGHRFASGGYPSQGSLFWAGEAGQPEIVGNIGGRTGVASGAEITGIGDAVWSTGNTTANLLAELISIVREKDLTIAPSASLGKVVSRSQKLYATQTG